MNTDISISGIHHITAVTSSAAENLAFYEKTLGLRLVKQTVNFDDPFTYHLYYGDANGYPGSDVFFGKAVIKRHISAKKTDPFSCAVKKMTFFYGNIS